MTDLPDDHPLDDIVRKFVDIQASASEIGDILTDKMDMISYMSAKWQDMLADEEHDVMIGIGAAMQIILHGCSQLAEQNLDRVPGNVTYETLFVFYVNSVMLNTVETADMNKQVEAGYRT